MSKLNHGTVIVEAGSVTYTLKSTLRAARAIESKFGGLLPAMSALTQGSVAVTAAIIAAGAGLDVNKRKELEQVEEQVFEGGVNAVGGQVLPFIQALLNPGGKTNAELAELAEAADQGNETPTDTSTNSSE
ncbi:hypothetical protein ACIPL1_30520 [Pseudomonas sp. NPDC090202]|uniref:hypothetical protein n=1 Tax=Pseudomonas sp. NPDC090202 TaxID=3364476 RepID=UPI0038089D1E